MIWSLYRQKRDSRLITQRPAWDHLAQTDDRKRGDTSERDVMPFTSLAATTAGLGAGGPPSIPSAGRRGTMTGIVIHRWRERATDSQTVGRS